LKDRLKYSQDPAEKKDLAKTISDREEELEGLDPGSGTEGSVVHRGKYPGRYSHEVHDDW